MFNWLKKSRPAPEKAIPPSDPEDAHVVESPSESVAAYRRRGNEFLSRGMLVEAGECYRRAIAINPNHAESFVNLGFVLTQQKLYAEAERCLKQAVQIDPTLEDAYFLLGGISRECGNLATAIENYNKALELKPDFEIAYCDLCQVLFQNGQIENAKDIIERGISIKPRVATFHFYLGNLYRHEGKLEQAIICYQKALSIEPDYLDVHYSIGNVLQDRGRLKEAEGFYRKALALNPDSVEITNNLGVLLYDQGELSEAITCLEKVVALRPDFSMAHNNLGLIFQALGALDKAMVCYRNALNATPEFHSARINLLYAQQHYCSWNELGSLSGQVRQAIRELPAASENPIPPFSFLAVAGSTPSEQRVCAHHWAQSTFQSQASRRKEMALEFKRESRSRLHLGYISADFRNHPVSHLMAEVFELHNREHFRITAYSYGPDDGSEMRKRLENAFDDFVDIRELNYESAARRIYDDRVDILVDLTGYTEHCRTGILALRPAPVQVGYLGFLGTMGADFMDYIIADPFLIPPGYEKHYSEKIAYLPSYQANDRHCAIAEAPTRKACGLPEEGFVFCCFNQTYKILPDVFDVWMRLLQAVPNSVFWVYVSYADAIENLRREGQARGVSPERLIFAERLPLDRHLARLKCADLFLDTLPYNAGTTASNALWAGLPVVTCSGETLSSRMAGSLLTALGVPELVTDNLANYYALALDLATDKNKYQKIRNKIIANRDSAPLFDSTTFTRNLEAAYMKMWGEYVDSGGWPPK
jgi:predicted O-linked N-acetylglucosamine transferase (SPINDLY family)